MADNDVFHAVFFEHGGGNFTRIGAFFRKVYVFRAELDIRSFKSFAYSGNVDRGDAYDDVAVRLFDERRDCLHESDALGRGIVHFPVACNDRFSHKNSPEIVFPFPESIITQTRTESNEKKAKILFFGRSLNAVAARMAAVEEEKSVDGQSRKQTRRKISGAGRTTSEKENFRKGTHGGREGNFS